MAGIKPKPLRFFVQSDHRRLRDLSTLPPLSQTEPLPLDPRLWLRLPASARQFHLTFVSVSGYDGVDHFQVGQSWRLLAVILFTNYNANLTLSNCRHALELFYMIMWSPPPSIGIPPRCRICGSTKVMLEKDDDLKLDSWGNLTGKWHCDKGHPNIESSA